jgi:hypothetical protein
MRRIAVLLTLSALAGAVPAAGSPPVPGPSGVLCSFVTLEGVGTVITGGPVVGDGTLTCTIQVGGGYHAAADNGAIASASNSGVVVVNPSLRSFVVPTNIPVYLCTQWTPSAGPTLYWNASNDPLVQGYWTTDAYRDCSLAFEAGMEDDDPLIDVVSSVVCPVLPLVFTGTVGGTVTITPQGDVIVAGTPVYDCPPYGTGNALPDTSILWAADGATF